MTLFASNDAAGVIVVLVLIGYLGFRAFIFFFRPEQWEAERQRKHEMEMAKSAERNAKAGKIVGGIAGGVAKALLGALIKGRPHS